MLPKIKIVFIMLAVIGISLTIQNNAFALNAHVVFQANTDTVANLNHSYKAESPTHVNDWTTNNYTIKSLISLNNFYLEFEKEKFTGGAGFKTFQKREGLVSALQDIEYQFFPVDATNPLRMKRIGVPGIWGKYNFTPNTYLKVVGYETLWSKISPEAVPELDHIKLDNPTGNQGYSLFTTLGTSFYDTEIEVGFTRGWVPWPTEKSSELESEFSPNPYETSALHVKIQKHFNNWTLTGTSMVKDANENAGSIVNMLFSFNKKFSLWKTPASIGASYFYVNSIEHSEHMRISPWEDLGNSFSIRAAINDYNNQTTYELEGVINHEEKGFYFMGITEKCVSDNITVKSQIDFKYDKEKYISDNHDLIRISGYLTLRF